MPSATHRFNGVDQRGANPTHPLAGMPCRIVERFGLSPSGYTCSVRVELEPALAAYARAAGGKITVDELRRHVEFQGWVRGDELEIKANEQVELELI
jgi:hypothetical protein